MSLSIESDTKWENRVYNWLDQYKLIWNVVKYKDIYFKIKTHKIFNDLDEIKSGGKQRSQESPLGYIHGQQSLYLF